MIWLSLVLIIVGLFFIGNTAYEGGVHIVLDWIKKDDGHKWDILISSFLALVAIIIGYRIGFPIVNKSPIFTIAILYAIIGVYIVIRNYFARIQ